MIDHVWAYASSSIGHRLSMEDEWFPSPTFGVLFLEEGEGYCAGKEWSTIPTFCKGAVTTPHPLKIRSQEFEDEDSRRTFTNHEVW